MASAGITSLRLAGGADKDRLLGLMKTGLEEILGTGGGGGVPLTWREAVKGMVVGFCCIGGDGLL